MTYRHVVRRPRSISAAPHTTQPMKQSARANINQKSTKAGVIHLRRTNNTARSISAMSASQMRVHRTPGFEASSGIRASMRLIRAIIARSSNESRVSGGPSRPPVHKSTTSFKTGKARPLHAVVRGQHGLRVCYSQSPCAGILTSSMLSTLNSKSETPRCPYLPGPTTVPRHLMK